MGRFYQPKEVAGLLGLSIATLKVWEFQGLIPKATRMGLNQRRIWHTSQVKRILEYARDLGYGVPYYPSIEGDSNEAKTKEKTAC